MAEGMSRESEASHDYGRWDECDVNLPLRSCGVLEFRRKSPAPKGGKSP